MEQLRSSLGETEILGNTTFANIQYAAVWNSTTGPKYVVVSGDSSPYTVAVFNENGSRFQIGNVNVGGTITSTGTPEWQHTEFNGGYHFILNNGQSTPIFLQADASAVTPLPNWDSYAVMEEVETFMYTGNGSIAIDIGTDDVTFDIVISPRNIASPIRTVRYVRTGTNLVIMGQSDATDSDLGSATLSGSTVTFVPASSVGGSTITFTILRGSPGSVTAKVVRAYGNLLVAGDLRETGTAGRTLTGTIRTSDVAAPGEIPTNWNPFRVGVNTADEFILASTGTIQDMAELQGVLYVYTDSSIHAIQQTGSPVTPFQISPVTNNFGADNIDGVIEVDGKHIVVGSDDVYVFAGHPGSISSIADGRVRDHFRDNKGYKVVRYNSFDELWFWRADTTIYVWNYRNNTWTKRVGTQPVSLNSGNGDLVLASSNVVSTVNNIMTYLENSFIERNRLALTPEFDTENLASIAMLASGSGIIDIRVRGTNIPGDTSGIGSDSSLHPFTIANDYKTDIRVHGRFLNYRMTHATTGYFETAGFQFDIGKGGTR